MARTNGVLGTGRSTRSPGARAPWAGSPAPPRLADRAERGCGRRAIARLRCATRWPSSRTRSRSASRSSAPPSAASPAAARRAGAARAAAQPLQRRLRAPRGDERQGPLPRAPRPDPGRLPRDQPGQGLQPALLRLLRELGRPRREARLGDLRAHGARGARRLGHARLRDQRRRAARVARRQAAPSSTSPSGSRTASS